MHSLVGPRLSVMMFLQFFMWGAWWVPMSIYLGTDRVDMEGLIFVAFLSQPIAAMVSPFFLGFIADRYFPSEKVLAVLHLLGAALLVAAPFVAEMDSDARQTGFITLVILHMACYMPTIGLTNAIAFNTMDDPERQFPVVRVFGTIGWIVSGLLVGVGLNAAMDTPAEQSMLPFFIGAGAAVLLGLYSFTLPHTPPPLKGKKATAREIMGLDAVSQLSSRSFWTFLISSLLICIPLATYYSYAAQFAGDSDMAREVAGTEIGVSAWMTGGQMTEALFMLLMPLAFRSLGVKWMLLAGMAAWVVRYGLFAMGAPESLFWTLLVGILFHGVAYDFFFVTGMVYVEKKASPAIRAQAQGFLVQMTLGVGMFIGMFASGWLFNGIVLGTEGAERMNQYQLFWIIPAGFAAVVMVFFGLLFKDEVPAEPVEGEEVAEAAAVDEQP